MTSTHTDTLPARGPEAVTVSITRRVDPRRVPEATHWVQEGVNLANTWPGFLGSGWVRASATSDEWHMLYRFADAAALDAWEHSEPRREWLERGRDMVEDRTVTRRTGIEGWFDSPSSTTDLEAPGTPPRWKQAVAIWLGFFPVNLAFTWLVGLAFPGWEQLPMPLRVLITTAVLTPIMAYWVLPWVTGLLQPWLARRRS
ncbi:hypothetical protein GCM10009636_04690 [Arthrobacter koreensis]|jgi:antibiotic biosynthesis monooxygenase (ABM) superfamily enzyme|uniref:Antibiotic biosynthesis monooxygenase n=1 Tax=Arthrobacter koreensis TaxID=199136 RepID=A0ABY6FRP6_9MICC|nr:antibiotic biosynthesis monooxygenase [Arthrobacter koreensis]MDF2498344.1 antibiotic biosynthesis monooxygenase [Arthrobacter koreensis]MEB7446821.1 antibiotic biosynthesis monooxygenase [Arthrobacter koreensis]UYB35884.1 antibiotic biosynthesis monooxygenase [Arthrobacter koreensis]